MRDIIEIIWATQWSNVLRYEIGGDGLDATLRSGYNLERVTNQSNSDQINMVSDAYKKH